MTELYDVLVVGGGINGAGIARDAVGRGLKVLLCEQTDLASATSSASSKLIHGGLRYLEQYEFRLVREALTEREVLLHAAPHIIWPLRFVLPYDAGMRPAWLLRLGLFIYDHLGGRKILPPTRVVDLRRDTVGQNLAERLVKGFEYSDCWVDDARLVLLNALDASERGAKVVTRCACRSAKRVGSLWEAELDHADGSIEHVQAKVLVNAAGPWVQKFRHMASIGGLARGVRLVKGSHIIVPRLHDGSHALTLQNADGRVVFVIPYQDKFSLIGTTDLPFDGNPTGISASEDEKSYLCATVGEYFKHGPTPADIVWSYAGVRPLYDDGNDNPSAVTRDYTLDIDTPAGQAPALTVYGGKITTYRCLAEEALDKLLPLLGHKAKAWTAAATLPGGDLPGADFERFVTDLGRRYAFVPPDMLRRMARAYGTRIERILGKAQAMTDLGRNFGGVLTEAELDHMKRDEWVTRPDDALWRRSKLGLHLTPEARQEVEVWFGQ